MEGRAGPASAACSLGGEMTLPAAFPLSASQINVELGRAAGAAFDMQGAKERTLAGVAAGAISMSDFLSKSSIAIVDTQGPTALSTSHNFATVNFGPAGPNRLIVVYVFGQTKSGGVTPVVGNTGITAFTAGGAANIFAPISFFFHYNTPAATTFVGVQSGGFQPSGTSGTVALTTGLNTRCSIVVLSMIASALPFSFGNDAGLTTTVTSTVDVSANGFLTSAGIATGATNLTLANSTERLEFSHIAGYECVIGFDAFLAGQAGRVITMTANVSSNSLAIIGESWT